MRTVFVRLFALSVALALGTGSSESFAGVFNIPHFVVPGEFALGIEPELLTTGAAAVGVNFRYTHGISDLSNLHGIIGTGGGARQFRVGGAYTLDFFPDIENQPGIGLAFQGLYVQIANAGTVEVTAIPYIHKSFKLETGSIEPFLSVPVGLALSQGTYQTLATIVMGGFFHHSQHLSSVLEVGIAAANSYTYVSGGLVYFH